jgi:hypothetical protein
VHREQRGTIQAVQFQNFKKHHSNSIKPPNRFEQAHWSSVGTHTSDPMMNSDEKCQKEGFMTRKLLLTAAIVALTLAPSIGTGTAQARGFFGAASGAAFTADSGAASMADSGAAFMADSVFFYPGYYRYGYFPYGYYRY